MFPTHPNKVSQFTLLFWKNKDIYTVKQIYNLFYFRSSEVFVHLYKWMLFMMKESKFVLHFKVRNNVILQWFEIGKRINNSKFYFFKLLFRQNKRRKRSRYTNYSVILILELIRIRYWIPTNAILMYLFSLVWFFNCI